VPLAKSVFTFALLRNVCRSSTPHRYVVFFIFYFMIARILLAACALRNKFGSLDAQFLVGPKFEMMAGI